MGRRLFLKYATVPAPLPGAAPDACLGARAEAIAGVLAYRIAFADFPERVADPLRAGSIRAHRFSLDDAEMHALVDYLKASR